MSFSRYRKEPVRRNGKVIGTSEGLVRLRRRMQRGEIALTTMTLKEGQRLDKLAHDLYGDGRLWWIIAACSGIGWWLQAPPSTLLRVPAGLDQIDVLF